MTIAWVKAKADLQAENARDVCQQMVPPLAAATIKPNYKFYRKLAGLRNGDLKREEQKND